MISTAKENKLVNCTPYSVMSIALYNYSTNLGSTRVLVLKRPTNCPPQKGGQQIPRVYGQLPRGLATDAYQCQRANTSGLSWFLSNNASSVPELLQGCLVATPSQTNPANPKARFPLPRCPSDRASHVPAAEVATGRDAIKQFEQFHWGTPREIQ